MTNEEVNGAFRGAITNLNKAFIEAQNNGITLKFNIMRGNKIEFKANELTTLAVDKVIVTKELSAKDV